MCILPHIRNVFRGLHSVFFTFAVSSCVKPAGIIVQVQEICWTVTKRIDSSCSVRCHALHDCHQTWSFQQAPSSKLINMRCGWALPSQCVASTQLGFLSGNMCATSTMSLHPTPPTHPNPTCYVASNMCATSTMSLHPTPPTHPNPTCYVASNMCAASTMSLHPTPPTHPNPTCYVASNMCATSTMSLHPTPPTQPNPRDRREGKCIDPTVYSGRSTFRNASLRPTGAKNKSLKNHVSHIWWSTTSPVVFFGTPSYCFRQLYP